MSWLDDAEQRKSEQPIGIFDISTRIVNYIQKIDLMIVSNLTEVAARTWGENNFKILKGYQFSGKKELSDEIVWETRSPGFSKKREGEYHWYAKSKSDNSYFNLSLNYNDSDGPLGLSRSFRFEKVQKYRERLNNPKTQSEYQNILFEARVETKFLSEENLRKLLAAYYIEGPNL